MSSDAKTATLFACLVGLALGWFLVAPMAKAFFADTATSQGTIEVCPDLTPVDTDGDGIIDGCDADDDNDGCSDGEESGAGDPGSMGTFRGDPTNGLDFHGMVAAEPLLVDASDVSAVIGAYGTYDGGAGWNPVFDLWPVKDSLVDASDVSEITGQYGLYCMGPV